jgi:ketosteroid isomerase-like protein
MKFQATLFIAAALAALGGPAAAQPAMDDKAQIEALENQFAAAVTAKDIDAIMKVYAPGQDLLVFDVVPPRQYAGFDAYKKDWMDFLGQVNGPIKFTISDLAIDTDGTMGYSHSVQHMTGVDTKGKAMDLTVRLTDVYKKMGGVWKIVHEHVSVPVDLTTGKPDLTAAP